MTKQILVIDGEDQKHFFLSVEAGTLTVGASARDAGAVLRDLHISRIRCEVEIDDERIVVGGPRTAGTLAGTGPPAAQELHVGKALQLGHTHLSLESVDEGPDTSLAPVTLEEPEPEPEPEAAPDWPQEGLARQLVVVDGADQGGIFSLPESGMVTIGKHKKHADIVLNDLYVSRVHCELQCEGGTVSVKHLSGDNGTLINGKPITHQQELVLGDVLRVGNSHLRLEVAVPGAEPAADGGEEDYEIIDEDEETEDEAAGGNEDEKSYLLPHSPIDELLELEDQVLGHFQIGQLLGRGQSSLVFRAQDVKTNRVVALKVLSPDFPANDGELQRFIRALKTVPQLQHPNLVALQGAGKTGPYCWITREYIDGESLARLVNRLGEGGKADWPRACRVAVQLGKLLGFLHEHGVCHGNITPRNILVGRNDRTIKLADLMLHEALQGSELYQAIQNKKLLTELPYRAPEHLDPATPPTLLGDVYSVGAVLYAVLSGHAPFTGDSPRELLAQIREHKVIKPSKHQPGIPAALEAIILKMMGRSPTDRLPTGAAIAAAVEAVAKRHDIQL